jgi:hypothetical protein
MSNFFQFNLVVPGKPIPKARPRMTKSGHTYTDKKTFNYEDDCQVYKLFSTKLWAVAPATHILILGEEGRNKFSVVPMNRGEMYEHATI